jgi:putative transposase
MGFWSLFLRPGRIAKFALRIRPSTLLNFHQCLVRRKYRRLFSSKKITKLGPKGPSDALIRAIVELKCRNTGFGCPRIALVISKTFGIEMEKNVVRRVLVKHYRRESGSDGPSWLTFIEHMKGIPLANALPRTRPPSSSGLITNSRPTCVSLHVSS